MTFWQGLIISLLAESTDILSSSGEAVTKSDNDDSQEKYAKQAQNFLICLEMLGFSIAHFYCFPVEEWEVDIDRRRIKVSLGIIWLLGTSCMI